MATWWSRWKRFAAVAADVQGQVLFFLLYFLVLLPIALVSAPRAVFGRARRTPPHWRQREPTSPDLVSARRQF